MNLKKNTLTAVIIYCLRFALFTHISYQKMSAKNAKKDKHLKVQKSSFMHFFAFLAFSMRFLRGTNLPKHQLRHTNWFSVFDSEILHCSYQWRKTNLIFTCPFCIACSLTAPCAKQRITFFSSKKITKKYLREM